MRQVFGPVLAAALAVFMVSCGGATSPGADDLPNELPSVEDNQPRTPTPTPTPGATPIPMPEPSSPPSTGSDEVLIRGMVSFDHVPHTSVGALDYNNLEQKPARGVTVQLLDASNAVLSQTSSDGGGNYALIAPKDRQVKVRVMARLQNTGAAAWDFRVTDNTSDNSLYVMDGSLSSSGSSDSLRNLNAASGWTGASYSQSRSAAPFAILDAIYEALILLLSADPNIQLIPSEARWSVNNKAIFGDRSLGNIGTSFYDPNENNFYVMGHANNDTDEYDRSVIQHELAHYLEDVISRSENIGGSHNISDKLDMRVAFGEGFGNAFTAMASNTGLYKDSFGQSQDFGFKISMESQSSASVGWFSENSVAKILYDIYDSQNDGEDTLSLGFTPIYRTLTSSNYLNANGFASIFLFSDVMRSQLDSVEITAFNELLAGEKVKGVNANAEGETNSGGVSTALPVYKSLSAGQTINVCSTNSEGEYNSLGARQYILVTLNASRNYTFSISKTSGSGTRDPDAVLYQRGNLVFAMESGLANTETRSITLTAGDYALDVYDHLNVDDNDSSGGTACFDVSIN